MTNLLAVLVLSCLLSLVLAVPVTDRNQTAVDKRWFNFGYGLGEKVRGVNLGGFLVLEPFINLSLFRQFPPEDTPVDEYHFCAKLGPDECSRQLQQHWSTWLSRDDFVQIKAAGLNHVRIPIGYWAFERKPDDPYVGGQLPYLEQALQWAREVGLKAWIDLHGAPGSQNGFDNSGLRDHYEWQSGDNLEMTKRVIKTLMDTYAAPQWNDVIVAIQAVNEPLGPIYNLDLIKEYYLESYSYLRNDLQSDIGFSIHDAFFDPPSWNGFMDYPDYTHVILDHHAYQVFSPGELSRSIDEHIATACDIGNQVKDTILWTVIGEWSAALTDCTEWLNGVYRGARYDGSYQSPFMGSCETRWDITTWSEQDKVDTRRYIEAQLDAYEQGQGWIFWCWKTENSIEWDFQRLLAAELIPQPLDSRVFINQCNY
ncbi:glycoside hydrolase superfamily [Dipodascopsis uninucleata]